MNYTPEVWHGTWKIVLRWKRRFLLETIIFRFHVKLQGGYTSLPQKLLRLKKIHGEFKKPAIDLKTWRIGIPGGMFQWWSDHPLHLFSPPWSERVRPFGRGTLPGSLGDEKLTVVINHVSKSWDLGWCSKNAIRFNVYKWRLCPARK